MKKICSKCCVEKNLEEMCINYKTGGYRSHCKECEKLRIRNYRKRNKDKYLKKAKEHSRKRLYGITQQEYEILLGIFPNCPICGETFTSSFIPHVDHDHETGKVRGLLCKFCNPGLGSFKEDISILEGAIAYLKNIKS